MDLKRRKGEGAAGFRARCEREARAEINAALAEQDEPQHDAAGPNLSPPPDRPDYAYQPEAAPRRRARAE